MSRRDPSTDRRVLRERLRREAAESQPEFSASLHERILSAIKQHHAAVAAVHRKAAANGLQRGLLALAAAACLLTAVAIGWRLFLTAAPPVPGNDLADNNRAWIERRQAIDHWADQTTAGLGGLVGVGTAKPRESVLTRDARLVASTLLEPLPVEVPFSGEP
jgi:hypothetical protein